MESPNSLKISDDIEVGLLLDKLIAANSTTVFCTKCKNVVSSICQLFHELLTVQLRLSIQLGELGDFLETSDVFQFHNKSLAEQLGVQNSTKDVKRLRKLLKTQCERKRNEGLPDVRIKRLVKQRQWSEAAMENEATEETLDMEADPFDESRQFGAENGNSCLFQSDLSSESGSNSDSDSQASESGSSSSSPSEPPQKRLKLGQEEYPCGVCSKAFPTSKQKRTHIFQCHNKKRYRCPECNIPIKSKVLKQHLVEYHKPQTHICNYCRKTFKTGKYLMDHITLTHSNLLLQHQNWPKCPSCHKTFERKHKLSRHLPKCSSTSNPEATLQKKPSDTELGESFTSEHSSKAQFDASSVTHQRKLTFANIAQKFSKL
ncbi:Zinc finger protein-likePLAG1 [Orchesella cincta]|uniref:Zinc finger protein-likePLAG1 n=1 Tax=Orchesella cincta TaxID=48709 RepID=A0A1D2MK12_ORCCI|nr:Zinc finger protein-likePLAG1 [Orchesella cincta]